MVYQINRILLNDELFSHYKITGDKEKVLKPLSRINIFVGPNNSGKSRFLRSIFRLREFEFIHEELDNEKIKIVITEFINEVCNFAGPQRPELTDKKIREVVNQIKLPTNFNEEQYLKYIKDVMGQVWEILRILRQNAFLKFQDILEQLEKKYEKKISDSFAGKEKATSFKAKEATSKQPQKPSTELYYIPKIYIPTLRGLRTFKIENKINDEIQTEYKDFYKDRTLFDYFFKISDDPEKMWLLEDNIYTGLDLYERIKSHLLGSLQERQFIREFEKYLSKSFFEDQEITLIPNIKSDVLYIKIGNEKEFPVYELGDGLQSIIILTFPLFEYKNEQLLAFIEEPELFLHPGLQRKFIETLSDEQFRNHQYFIATHSNHFLDISMDIPDISIFTCRKETIGKAESTEIVPNFMIENVSSGDRSILELLDVRNASVFLSNCTIWVEGITDRLYIRKYLEILQGEKQEYKEDLHYSFVEYGGSNITHWSFLDNSDESIDVERLCGKLFLIADTDGVKVDEDSAKAKRLDRLQQVLGDRFYRLPCREIENLLKKDVLCKVIGEYEGEQPDFKNSDFKEDDYKDAYLGEFIETNLKSKKRKGSYASDSGTIKDKVKLCWKAVNHIKTKDDLSESTVDLTEAILAFIRNNNT